MTTANSPHRPGVQSFFWTTLCILLALALIPSQADAAFTRPFLRQVTGRSPSEPFPVTENGPNGYVETLISGVATDQSGDLWILERTPSNSISKWSLLEFNPAGAFLRTVELGKQEGLRNLALSSSTGDFYVPEAIPNTNGHTQIEVLDENGTVIRHFGELQGGPLLAVDSSADPADPFPGAVFATSAGLVSDVVVRFDAAGKPLPFSGSASYVSGNEITGSEEGSFGTAGVQGLAIDPKGDIYVLSGGGGGHQQSIVEFSPAGKQLRTITGAHTPGFEGDTTNGGFGGPVEGLAFEPVSEHLLAAVRGSRSVTHGVVDEFNSSGDYVAQIFGSSPGNHLHQPRFLATDTTGDVYVGDFGRSELNSELEHAVDVYGPGRFLPGLRLSEPSSVTATEATLNGAVNPESLQLSGCSFEYISDAELLAHGWVAASATPCAPPAASITPDSLFHPVQATVNGLMSGTTYRYRVSATSAGELGGTGHSESGALTAPASPRVESTVASNLSSTFADLEARIDPLGAATSYYFEYVDAAEYEPSASDPYAGGAKIPLTPAAIGSGGATGSAIASVQQQIGGLEPSTIYHFRVVASNVVGTSFGPDSTFATLAQVSLGLPDGRAYELVTPASKGGAVDLFAAGEVNSGEPGNQDFAVPSESGDRILLDNTLAAFGSFPASEHNSYVFSRDPAGWQTTSLALPDAGVQSLGEGRATVFDPELSRVAFNDIIGSEASPLGTVRTNFVGRPGGPYQQLHADQPLHEESEPAAHVNETYVVGGSLALGTVVLESRNHEIAPGAVSQDPDSHALYGWTEQGLGECEPSAPDYVESAGGCISLINVKSSGALLSQCGALLGQSQVSGTRHAAVSADGKEIFFTSPDPYMTTPHGESPSPGCWELGSTHNAPQLYMRSGATTTEVSAPEEGAPEAGGRHPAYYVGASHDGSKVFFVTESELTSDDTGIHGPELYEYDTQSGVLTRVSHGESGTAEAGVSRVPAIAADGSVVYFTANGVLASNLGADGTHAASGSCPLGGNTKGGGFHETCNLYRYDTASGVTRYISRIGSADYPEEAANGGYAGDGRFLALQFHANWYSTNDGSYLLFASNQELTGYSTVPAQPTECRSYPNRPGSGGHCVEVYRYESSSNSLVCVSCNPSGAPPTGHSLFERSQVLGPAAGPTRPMSDNGSYVFFDTIDGLVPADNNGTTDVYEWHDGKLSLISSGHDAGPSFFLGASSNGRDVFFGTHSRLVPADIDLSGDIYDARVGGGFPPSQSHEGECEGDACARPLPAPSDGTPGSLGYSGPGNVGESRSAKPKKKRKHHRHRHRGQHRHGAAKRADPHPGGHR